MLDDCVFDDGVTIVPSPRMNVTVSIEFRLFTELLRFGLVSGTVRREDSQGRAVLEPMPIAEVVHRAAEMAELAVAESYRRGWLEPVSAGAEA